MHIKVVNVVDTVVDNDFKPSSLEGDALLFLIIDLIRKIF